eukprot:scaffold1691_cov107-Isochrysis_galbana.AAC.14
MSQLLQEAGREVCRLFRIACWNAWSVMVSLGGADLTTSDTAARPPAGRDGQCLRSTNQKPPTPPPPRGNKYYPTPHTGLLRRPTA